MPPQNNIKRLPQVLLHFHLEEYITKSIMMLCILSRPAMAFFLVSLNSGSDFRLRHLSEVKISRTTLSALIFGLAPEQKISLGILHVHMKGRRTWESGYAHNSPFCSR